VDRFRGFSTAAVVLSTLALSLSVNAWMTGAGDVDPRRGLLLAAVALPMVVLPLATNPWQTNARRRRVYLQTALLGQSFAAVGGLWVVAAPVHPEYGLVVTAVACLACLAALRRKARPARPCRA